ncbi:hypothetical protein SAMN05216316_2920 [Nitrosovibrio sp. Nv6]|nr:hypothetical protein SAMN05216316_2920 [Nitrosovibrio sp. Nv6]
MNLLIMHKKTIPGGENHELKANVDYLDNTEGLCKKEGAFAGRFHSAYSLRRTPETESFF